MADLKKQMNALKAKQKAQIEHKDKKLPLSVKEQAHKNAIVSKGSKSTGLDTLKKGVPLDQTTKHDILNANKDKFGLNLGVTKNMENYESLRVDVWATDTLRTGETLNEGCQRLKGEIEVVLQEIVEEYVGEE